MSGLTPLQVLLVELDPIVGCYVDVGSPVGDPLGIEHNAKPIRLSDVLTASGELRLAAGSAVGRELDRLGWNLR